MGTAAASNLLAGTDLEAIFLLFIVQSFVDSSDAQRIFACNGSLPYVTIHVCCRAAVYFETGDLEKCIEDCDSAVEKARALRADYKLIGKALTRKGNALVKKDDLEGAIAIYQKALTEHRFNPLLPLVKILKPVFPPLT